MRGTIARQKSPRRIIFRKNIANKSGLAFLCQQSLKLFKNYSKNSVYNLYLDYVQRDKLFKNYLKMAQNQARLQEVLRQSGLTGARELAGTLGVSQPTVSRLLRTLLAETLRTHTRGRGVRYAGLRPIPVLDDAAYWQLFQVDEAGTLQKEGVLHSIYGAGGSAAFYVEGGAFEGAYASLPWFL